MQAGYTATKLFDIIGVDNWEVVQYILRLSDDFTWVRADAACLASHLFPMPSHNLCGRERGL